MANYEVVNETLILLTGEGRYTLYSIPYKPILLIMRSVREES